MQNVSFALTRARQETNLFLGWIHHLPMALPHGSAISFTIWWKIAKSLLYTAPMLELRQICYFFEWSKFSSPSRSSQKIFFWSSFWHRFIFLSHGSAIWPGHVARLYVWLSHMAKLYGSAIWQSYMALPYGRVVWPSHMAMPYGLAIWLRHETGDMGPGTWDLAPGTRDMWPGTRTRDLDKGPSPAANTLHFRTSRCQHLPRFA